MNALLPLMLILMTVNAVFKTGRQVVLLRSKIGKLRNYHMRKTLILFLVFAPLLREAGAFPSDSVKQIHDLIFSLYENGEFNGSILVVSNGKILYTNGFGMSNFKTSEKFTSSTASCIASVTKQFTAVGIMMLAEQNKLAYEDPVTKFIELPECYDQVTIRNLLTHTSGVFEYSDLGSGRPDRLIFKANSLHFPPGQRYEYSNSNYVLLSVVIEKDRKSTRLNSSHSQISYAVFCLKK